MAGSLLKKLKDWLCFWKWKSAVPEKNETEELVWVNPYLPYMREILEALLKQKNLDYRRFQPIILDTDRPNQSFGEPDDVEQVLSQLLEGLNFLEICTDRPEHFEMLKEKMEQESGLLIRLLPKQSAEKKHGNFVLDFERGQPIWIERFPRDVLYLPVYKRRWQEKPAENGENTGEPELDIEVPIGYNMMIVKKNKNR